MSAVRWPKLYPVQHSFSSGEVSPRLLARSDLEGYASSVSEMTNMRPDAQGPAVRRSGMRFVKELPSAVHHVKMAPFYLDEGSSPAIAIRDDGIVNVLVSSSNVVGASLLTNRDFATDLSGWIVLSDNQGAVKHISGGGCQITTTATPASAAGIRQQFTVVSGTLQHYVFLRLRNGSSPIGSVQVRLGTTEGGSEIAESTLDPNADFSTLWQPPSGGAYWLEVELAGNGVASSVDIQLTNVAPVTNSDVDVELPGSPYVGEQVYDIQYAQAPGTLDLYLAHPSYLPRKVSYDRLTDVWSFGAATFTAQPAAWNDTNGWPQCVTFHQQRLFLGPTAQQPETFWGSRSGVFEDFTIGAANDDDALAFTLSRRGRIEWMEGGVKNFLIGTARSEFVISSDAGTITPSDINVEPQSAYGSRSTQAAPLGERVLFVSPDGRKVRSMGYRWTEEGWIATDITFPSEHITLSGVKEIHFAQDPDNLVVMPSVTGADIVGCTYERSSNSIGFFRDVTDGAVLSAAVAEFLGTSLTWVATRRWHMEGGNRVERTMLEYFPGLTFLTGDVAPDPDIPGYYETFVSGRAFMDSFIREDGLERTKVIVGGHLEGRTVQVVADGARLLDKVVDSSGEITLEVPASVVYVGLPYTSRMVTMPIEVGAVVARGSGASLFKRYNKILLRLYQSAMPLVNGETPADRTPSTPMDTPEPLKSGFIEVSNLGFDREARITIETDLPYPLEVLGVYGHFGQDDL